MNLRRLDYDEIVTAVRWGGKLGVVPLCVASFMLVGSMVRGEVLGRDPEAWGRWVRIGVEFFLMAGWSFGVISLVRQYFARTVGHLPAVFAAGLCGTLVDNMMGVFFQAIAPDAPPPLLTALLGCALSFIVAGVLTSSARR